MNYDKILAETHGSSEIHTDVIENVTGKLIFFSYHCLSTHYGRVTCHLKKIEINRRLQIEKKTGIEPKN